MATSAKNLSSTNFFEIENAASLKVGLVVSEWNDTITTNLLKGAKDTLQNSGLQEKNIEVVHTPGTFELPLAAQLMFERKPYLDGIVAIGSVIQGETRHFDFVCQGVTQGVMQVSLKYDKPVIFCVLTDENMQQAIDRSGGKHGNKGIESAVALLKMIQLRKSI